MFNLIKKLALSFGVSGNEEEISDLIESEVKDFVDEVRIDTLGNLICKKNGTGKKIMLSAHMDEVGVMATNIDKNGYIRFAELGGSFKHYGLGQRVQFKNEHQGVIFYDDKATSPENVQVHNMYIDIGAKNKSDALKKVNIGDVASLTSEVFESGENIISKGLNNRVSCAILIELIKNIKKTDKELYFVFTTQELIGFRAAKIASHEILPDLVIDINCTDSDDIADKKNPDIKLGFGPAIKIKDRAIIAHKEVKSMLEEKAKFLNIDYQYEIKENSISDGGVIHLTAGGIKCGGLSIPCRYMFTNSEMVNIKDVKDAVKILQEIVK